MSTPSAHVSSFNPPRRTVHTSPSGHKKRATLSDHPTAIAGSSFIIGHLSKKSTAF
jgi:hypothetical protein